MVYGIAVFGFVERAVYRDILALPGQERPPIISDVIPSTSQVTVGSRFCVMLDSKRNIFVEALVYEINRQVSPSQFLVKLRAEGEAGEKTWVRRAQLRLTLVPWQEEILVAAQQGNIITSSPPLTAVKTEPQTQTQTQSLPPGNTRLFLSLMPVKPRSGSGFTLPYNHHIPDRKSNFFSGKKLVLSLPSPSVIVFFGRFMKFHVIENFGCLWLL